jgi:hypothetical protein
MLRVESKSSSLKIMQGSEYIRVGAKIRASHGIITVIRSTILSYSAPAVSCELEEIRFSEDDFSVELVSIVGWGPLARGKEGRISKGRIQMYLIPERTKQTLNLF